MAGMTLTETLFGGLLVTVFIFFMTKKIGLANFWSGVLGAVVPFVGYLYYASSNWPSGDVLAIHFVVYLASAAVLVVFWKGRANKERMHWAPKLMIAFFVFLVVLMAMFVSLSSQGLPSAFTSLFLPNSEGKHINTSFPGAVPHERNKLYESYVKEVEQQKALGWAVEVTGMDAIKVDVPSELTIRLLDKGHHAIHGAAITMEFWRMAKSADDAKVNFTETSEGVYKAQVRLQDKGLWVTTLEIVNGEQKYSGRQSISVETN